MSTTTLTRVGIEWDNERAEYFIPLRTPYEHIRMTPPRLDDAPSLTRLLNQVEINSQLRSTPTNFPAHSVEDWLARLIAASKQWLTVLRDEGVSDLHRIGGLPFDVIRAKVDGTNQFELIGNLAMYITDNPKSRPVKQVTDVEPSKYLTDGLTLSNVKWRVGYFLDSNFTGKGIMTACLLRYILLVSDLTAIADVEAPLPTIYSTIWESNRASGKVLEKCGFRRTSSGLMIGKEGREVAFIDYQCSQLERFSELEEEL